MAGAPPQIPSLTGLKRSAPEIVAVIQKGAGRMPSFPNLSAADTTAIAKYILSGENKERSQQD